MSEARRDGPARLPFCDRPLDGDEVAAPRRVRWVLAALLLGISALTIFPLVWLVVTSIRPANTVFGGSFLPRSVTFHPT